MAHLRQVFAALILLSLLAGCLTGDDDDPTATLEPPSTVAAPTTTVAAAPTSADEMPADLAPSPTVAPPVTATATATTEPTPASTLAPPAVPPTIVFDATPTADPDPTAVADFGILYELVETLGQPTLPQSPADISIREDGSFAIADAGRGEVHLADGARRITASWPARALLPWDNRFTTIPPEHIVAANTSLYVTSWPTNALIRYSEAGDALAQHNFDEFGLTPFDLVAGPDGRIYVAASSFQNEPNSDEHPFGIYIFDQELGLLEIWDASAASLMPLALAFDADGTLHALVLSSNLSRGGSTVSRAAQVVTIDPTAYAASAWENSTEFELEGLFNGLAVTTAGDYVLIEEVDRISYAEGMATTVYLVTPDGQEIERWEVAGHIAPFNRFSAGVALITAEHLGGSLDIEDRILLADSLGQRIHVLELDGESAAAWGDDPAHLSTPSGLAVNADGEVAVLDLAAREIAIFEPDSSRPNRYEIDVLLAHPVLGTLGRLFYGPDNSIFYIDPNRPGPFATYRVDLTTGAMEVFQAGEDADSVLPFIFNPVDGAAGADGLLYIAETQDARSFEADGQHGDTWPVSDEYQVADIWDIAAGPDGVYLVWSGQAGDAGGTIISRFGYPDDPAVGGAFSDAEPESHILIEQGEPRVIAVGLDGLVYVLNPLTNVVQVLDGLDNIIASWTAGSYDPQQRSDIAVDAAGRVYVSDAVQRELLVYAPVGG